MHRDILKTEVVTSGDEDHEWVPNLFGEDGEPNENSCLVADYECVTCYDNATIHNRWGDVLRCNSKAETSGGPRPAEESNLGDAMDDGVEPISEPG